MRAVSPQVVTMTDKYARAMVIRIVKASQRGIALLIVLWVMAILIAMVFSFSLLTRAEVYGTLAFKDGMEKQLLAEAGIERGITEMIFRSVNAGRTAVLEGEEVWQTDGTAYYSQLANGNYFVRIFDEAGKISLNGMTDASGVMLKNLLVNLGSPPEEADAIVDSILDWKDADDLHHLAGVESDYYQSLPNPYQARNADFESLEELLLVKGITKDIFYGNEKRKGLINFLTMYNKSNKINLKAAPPEVLAAIPGMDPALVEQIMAARKSAAVPGAPDVTAALAAANPLLAPYIGGQASGAAMVCTIAAAGYKDLEKKSYPITATVVIESPGKYRYVYYRSPAENL